MKLGIVVYSTDAETAWYPFRLRNFAEKEGDQVYVCLLTGEANCESMNIEKSNIAGQMLALVDGESEFPAFGTCLKIRNK